MYYALGVSILPLSKIFLVDFGTLTIAWYFLFFILIYMFEFFQNYISGFYHFCVMCSVKTISRAFFYLYDCRRGMHTSHFATYNNYTLRWHLINSVNVLLYIDIMVTMVWWKYVAVTNSQNHIWIAMWLFHLFLKCSTNRIWKIILDIEINDLILS